MNNKVIIVGCSNPIFVVDTAEVFTSLGWEAEIAFRTTPFKKEDYGQYKTVYCIDEESKLFRIFLGTIYRVLSFIEKLYLAMRKEESSLLVSSILIQSWSVANYINKTNPDVVFVHSVSEFSMINSFLKKNVKTIVMPWGADIYEYVNNSNINYKVVDNALKKFDLIAPISVNASQYIKDTFKIPSDRIYANKYQITGHGDINKIIESTPSKKDIKNKLNIPLDSIVYMNIRRSKPKWGSREYLATALELIKENNNSFFIVITGDLGEIASKEYKHYIEVISKNNVEDKFLIVNSMLSFNKYLELLYVADIGLSLMHSGDMRSSSIMAAFALGLPLILSNQKEYLELKKEGFKFQMVDYTNILSIVQACQKFVEEKDFYSLYKENNKRLINNSYYRTRGVLDMLEMIDFKNEKTRC